MEVEGQSRLIAEAELPLLNPGAWRVQEGGQFLGAMGSWASQHPDRANVALSLQLRSCQLNARG